MNSKVGFVGAVALTTIGVVACTPDLKPTFAAADNARSANGLDIGPNQHNGVLKVTPMGPDDVAKFMKADDAPLCTSAGGKATPGPKWADVQGHLEKWAAARANVAPGPQASAAGSATKNGAQASASVGGHELISGPVDGDPLNVLQSFTLECAADKPVMHVNGQARPVDVLWGQGRVTGAELGLTSAEGRRVIVVAGWNAASNELTIVRAQTGWAPTAQNPDNTYPTWNAVVFRNLEGYVPSGSAPIAVRQIMPNAGNNDALEVVFPMNGMAIKADALIVRAPLEGNPGSPEVLELAAVVKQAK